LNPVMIKEFRTRRFGRMYWLLRLVSACALLSLTLTYATTAGTLDWGVETIGGILVLLQVALLVVFTPALASGLISTERESGGWDLLRTTPLSATRILIGKLSSALWTLALLLLATLPGYIVMVWIEPKTEPQVRRVVVCLVATALFSLVWSAAAGCLFRRTAAATTAGYLALLAVCGGPMLVWLGRDAPFSRVTVERALVISPLGAALSVIKAPGFAGYDLIPANWWAMAILSGIAGIVLIAQTWRLTRPT
jgi:ABC-type transport system involved in multi-copper enzyme maturation permease subunit